MMFELPKITQELCEQYVERGLLNRSVNGDLTLYCYSKETFFTGEWDDVTKSCRGLVFYKGEQVNHPFPKIFNLDETPETSFDVVEELINRGEKYAICHKVNGHLTIVDYIPELDKFVVHTKGSIQDNEMIDADKEMFFNQRLKMMQKVRKMGTRFTFMFESIHEDDQHTLYEDEVAQYGKNRLVLLGGYYQDPITKDWHSLPPYSLWAWSTMDDQPTSSVLMSDDGDFTHKGSESLNRDRVKEMFAEQNTEGYVIWFPSLDFRVKIKTTDYWKMRFRKELNADSIIERFVKGGDGRLYSRYPEEIAPKVVEQIEKYFNHYVQTLIVQTPIRCFEADRKDVALDKELSKVQKTLIFAVKDGKVNMLDGGSLMSAKQFREGFKEYMDKRETFKEDIKNALVKYIEDREV